MLQFQTYVEATRGWIARSLAFALLGGLLGACSAFYAPDPSVQAVANDYISAEEVVLDGDRAHPSSGDDEVEPADQAYWAAWDALLAGKPREAATGFRGVEDEYPFSDRAASAQLMAAYAQFASRNYDAALGELDRFILFHPAHEHIDYAYYLKALVFYQRISGVGRDMKTARLALAGFRALERRFPDSRLAADAAHKAQKVRDLLAANHIATGRYYQDRGELLAAINRFRLVTEEFAASSHLPEALHRLAESYLALGIIEEAQYAEAALERYFPDSEWSRESHVLLVDAGVDELRSAALAWRPTAQDGRLQAPNSAAPQVAQIEERAAAPHAGSSQTSTENGVRWASLPVSSPGSLRGSRVLGSEASLLQRWSEPLTSDGEIALWNGERELEITDGATQLRFASDWNRDGSGKDWRNFLRFDGNAIVGDWLHVQFDSGTVERRRRTDNEILGLPLEDLDEWEEGTVSNSKFTAGILDDRLRWTTSYSWSRYRDADTDYQERSGQSVLHRLDAEIWESRDLSLSVYGSHGLVDSDFESIEDDKRFLPLSDTNRITDEIGTRIELGPVALGVSWDRSQQAEDGSESDDFRRFGYEGNATLNLDDLRDRFGNPLGDTFWSIAPGSLWLTYGSHQVDIAGGGDTYDRTTDFSVGASWGWDSAYGNLSYWRSIYDGRQPSLEDADWLGDGLDLGLGFFGQQWTLDGVLSISRAMDLYQYSDTSEINYGTYLSFGYRPIELPDWTVSVGFDRYQADYEALDGTSIYDSWVARAELDFTKYWPQWWETRIWAPWSELPSASLKLVFQLQGDTSFEEWSSAAEQEGGTDFFVGFRVDIGLGE
jgi:outer membrane protein assembly factor BamD